MAMHHVVITRDAPTSKISVCKHGQHSVSLNKRYNNHFAIVDNLRSRVKLGASENVLLLKQKQANILESAFMDASSSSITLSANITATAEKYLSADSDIVTIRNSGAPTIYDNTLLEVPDNKIVAVNKEAIMTLARLRLVSEIADYSLSDIADDTLTDIMYVEL